MEATRVAFCLEPRQRRPNRSTLASASEKLPLHHESSVDVDVMFPKRSTLPSRLKRRSMGIADPEPMRSDENIAPE
jgi:hypothetical protein